MKPVLRAAAIALALAPAATATPAAAQDYSWAATWYAGGVYFTPFNSNGLADADDLELDPGWFIGLQGERWIGSGRWGIRVNGGVTERPFSLPGRVRNIAVWLADMDVMVRFLPVDPFRRFNAFASLGAGFVDYELGDGRFLDFGFANAFFFGENRASAAVNAGLGLDFITDLLWDDQPVGVRIELADHVVFDSPFEPLTGNDFSPVHNVRLVIGFFSGFGILR